MPVPSSITDLSTTPSGNGPAGSEAPSSLDDYQRALAAIVRQVYDAQQATNSADTAALALKAPLASPALTGTPTAPTAATATNTTQLATTAFVQAVAAAIQTVPTGAVNTFAMTTPPSGWLKCDGAAISRATYAALFAAIGTVFGVGDGSTTFNVPDLRGEFVRGFDDGKGTDSGRVFGSGQSDEIKSHTHAFNYAAGNWNIGNSAPYATVNANRDIYGPGATSATGGAETRPRNIALLYCIKV